MPKVLICGLMLVALVRPATSQGRPPSATPDSARLITSDIALFWSVYDRATPETLAALLQRDYLDAGSDGLRDFIPYRILSAESLAARVLRQRDRYEAARANTLRILAAERAIRAPLYALEHLYPDAVHPDVYFVIGRFNSGGTTSRRGLLIGAEMQRDFGEMVRLVAHESIHYQQLPLPSSRTTLLAGAIREGSADFLAELASGRLPSAGYMEYGLAHEAELWREFRTVMGARDFGGWLYGGQPAGRPADLGYFMGYRIAEAYYRRAADKGQAIRDIILVRDFEKFLADSGYDP